MRFFLSALLIAPLFAFCAEDNANLTAEWQLKAITLKSGAIMKGLVLERDGRVFIDDGSGAMDFSSVVKIEDLPDAEKETLRVSIEKRREVTAKRRAESGVAVKPPKPPPEDDVPAKTDAVEAPQTVEDAPKNADAQDNIEGAFGKKLGATFDPGLALGAESTLKDGTRMYEFRPKNPFRSFTKYYVLITPKTKKIYAILGIGEAENTDTAKKEQALVMDLLQKKYGVEQDTGVLGKLYDAKLISKGNRMVGTKVSGFGSVTIDIRYYDNELTKVAEKSVWNWKERKWTNPGFDHDSIFQLSEIHPCACF